MDVVELIAMVREKMDIDSKQLSDDDFLKCSMRWTLT